MKYDINIYQHISTLPGTWTVHISSNAGRLHDDRVEVTLVTIISEGGMCVSMVSWMAILAPNIWNKSGTVHVMVKRWDE